MNKKRYTGILYFIILVIGVTLITQIYWNYKNYQAGKQQLINEVQISLDQAVDSYYEMKAAQNTLGFIGNQLPDSDMISNQLRRYENLSERGFSQSHTVAISDSLNDLGYLSITGANSEQIDSILEAKKEEFNAAEGWGLNIYSDSPVKQEGDVKLDSSSNVFKLLTAKVADSSRQEAIKNLTSKIVISFSDDRLDLNSLDSLVDQELQRKQIDRIDHRLIYRDNPRLRSMEKSNQKVDSTEQQADQEHYDLYVQSNSNLLPNTGTLELGFENVEGLVLQRNMVGIGISFLLLAAVVACLLYLLKIIQEQHKLAEIRNDFISNITHEFKTPMATIGVALEGLQHFNQENDPEKTEKYLGVSRDQLGKLNIMVEKILETATLDKERLQLDRAPTSITDLLEKLVQKHQQNVPEVSIEFHRPDHELFANLDVFHFENAVDNLLDNAIKYGLPPIIVQLSTTKGQLLLQIIDQGTSLQRDHAQRLFEKFYRVPKGNQHDIKGFGIGLYYTRTIIEKHGGSIEVKTQPSTSFIIKLPYAEN
ncbi:sensor histidine kinase [Croceiramulus getboli]|nr:HAMP domain-containing sensor histidine kinase [Flavobacteriaceae bacterium YJPT1-3]